LITKELQTIAFAASFDVPDKVTSYRRNDYIEVAGEQRWARTRTLFQANFVLYGIDPIGST
jgi:hypothetical protein